jgi:predicted nucleotidyltransferase component of viral defense system
MDNAILQMLAEYKCKSTQDYENALKEIMQEIALLGLWRAKFYEHALFYGGTALRILYGLPRFSEDLDFSLLKPDSKFNLNSFHRAISEELEAFGFEVDVQAKTKTVESAVESAFIKAETKVHLLKIKSPASITSRLQGGQSLKIKIEVDTQPPGMHGIEVMDLMRPVPFQVKTMPLPDLFAGKLHAVLARAWGNRVKGRDFYDYLWYLSRGTPVHLKHLEARLIQSGHHQGELSEKKFRELLTEKFSSFDVDKAKADVAPFLNQRELASLELWKQDFFLKTIEKIKIQ